MGKALTRWHAGLPVAVCLVLNGLLFVGVAVSRPEYLRDAFLSPNPDAHDYVQLGRNVFLHGEFSRSRAAPYVPDMLRTPVFPAVAGALDLGVGAWGIYLANILFHAGTCWLLYLTVRRFLGRGAALAASLLLATDLVLVVNNFEAMTEPLFLFLLLASIFFFLRGAFPQSPGRGGPLALGAAGGLLALTVLTRPVAQYLAFFYLLVLGVQAVRARPVRRWLAGAALLLVAYGLPVGAWVVRNQVVCSLPRVSFVDGINLVYYAGAGAYQVERGVPFETAQAMIAEEHGLIPVDIVQNDFAGDHPPAEINAQLQASWRGVLGRYPVALLKSSLGGVAKASVSHNVNQLAALLGRRWEAPGTGSLLRGDAGAAGRLWGNGPLLVAALGWESLHAVGTLLLALAGCALLWRERVGRRAVCLLLPVLGYFYLTVALFGYEAYHRCRIPLLPFLCILAGVALGRVVARVRQRGRAPAPPAAGPPRELAETTPVATPERLSLPTAVGEAAPRCN